MGPQQCRQRPISCHFCRVRKLRCSRTFPCSNCTSRGVSCQQGPQATASVTTPEPQAKPVAKDDVAPNDMLSRLEKLEALVASQGKELEMTRQPGYPVLHQPVAAVSSSATPSSSSPPMPLKLERLTAEALWLEQMCAGHRSVVCIPHALVARVLFANTSPQYRL